MFNLDAILGIVPLFLVFFSFLCLLPLIGSKIVAYMLYMFTKRRYRFRMGWLRINLLRPSIHVQHFSAYLADVHIVVADALLTYDWRGAVRSAFSKDAAEGIPSGRRNRTHLRLAVSGLSVAVFNNTAAYDKISKAVRDAKDNVEGDVSVGGAEPQESDEAADASAAVAAVTAAVVDAAADSARAAGLTTIRPNILFSLSPTVGIDMQNVAITVGHYVCESLWTVRARRAAFFATLTPATYRVDPYATRVCGLVRGFSVALRPNTQFTGATSAACQDHINEMLAHFGKRRWTRRFGRGIKLRMPRGRRAAQAELPAASNRRQRRGRPGISRRARRAQALGEMGGASESDVPEPRISMSPLPAADAAADVASPETADAAETAVRAEDVLTSERFALLMSTYGERLQRDPRFFKRMNTLVVPVFVADTARFTISLDRGGYWPDYEASGAELGVVAAAGREAVAPGDELYPTLPVAAPESAGGVLGTPHATVLIEFTRARAFFSKWVDTQRAAAASVLAPPAFESQKPAVAKPGELRRAGELRVTVTFDSEFIVMAGVRNTALPYTPHDHPWLWMADYAPGIRDWLESAADVDAAYNAGRVAHGRAAQVGQAGLSTVAAAAVGLPPAASVSTPTADAHRGPTTPRGPVAAAAGPAHGYNAVTEPTPSVDAAQPAGSPATAAAASAASAAGAPLMDDLVPPSTLQTGDPTTHVDEHPYAPFLAVGEEESFDPQQYFPHVSPSDTIGGIFAAPEVRNRRYLGWYFAMGAGTRVVVTVPLAAETVADLGTRIDMDIAGLDAEPRSIAPPGVSLMRASSAQIKMRPRRASWSPAAGGESDISLALHETTVTAPREFVDLFMRLAGDMSSIRPGAYPLPPGGLPRWVSNPATWTPVRRMIHLDLVGGYRLVLPLDIDNIVHNPGAFAHPSAAALLALHGTEAGVCIQMDRDTFGMASGPSEFTVHTGARTVVSYHPHPESSLAAALGTGVGGFAHILTAENFRVSGQWEFNWWPRPPATDTAQFIMKADRVTADAGGHMFNVLLAICDNFFWEARSLVTADQSRALCYVNNITPRRDAHAARVWETSPRPPFIPSFGFEFARTEMRLRPDAGDITIFEWMFEPPNISGGMRPETRLGRAAAAATATYTAQQEQAKQELTQQRSYPDNPQPKPEPDAADAAPAAPAAFGSSFTAASATARHASPGVAADAALGAGLAPRLVRAASTAYYSLTADPIRLNSVSQRRGTSMSFTAGPVTAASATAPFGSLPLAVLDSVDLTIRTMLTEAPPACGVTASFANRLHVDIGSVLARIPADDAAALASCMTAWLSTFDATMMYPLAFYSEMCENCAIDITPPCVPDGAVPPLLPDHIMAAALSADRVGTGADTAGREASLAAAAASAAAGLAAALGPAPGRPAGVLNVEVPPGGLPGGYLSGPLGTALAPTGGARIPAPVSGDAVDASALASGQPRYEAGDRVPATPSAGGAGVTWSTLTHAGRAHPDDAPPAGAPPADVAAGAPSRRFQLRARDRRMVRPALHHTHKAPLSTILRPDSMQLFELSASVGVVRAVVLISDEDTLPTSAVLAEARTVPSPDAAAPATPVAAASAGSATPQAAVVLSLPLGFIFVNSNLHPGTVKNGVRIIAPSLALYPGFAANRALPTGRPHIEVPSLARGAALASAAAELAPSNVAVQLPRWAADAMPGLTPLGALHCAVCLEQSICIPPAAHALRAAARQRFLARYDTRRWLFVPDHVRDGVSERTRELMVAEGISVAGLPPLTAACADGSSSVGSENDSAHHSDITAILSQAAAAAAVAADGGASAPAPASPVPPEVLALSRAGLMDLNELVSALVTAEEVVSQCSFALNADEPLMNQLAEMRDPAPPWWDETGDGAWPLRPPSQLPLWPADAGGPFDGLGGFAEPLPTAPAAAAALADAFAAKLAHRDPLLTPADTALACPSGTMPMSTDDYVAASQVFVTSTRTRVRFLQPLNAVVTSPVGMCCMLDAVPMRDTVSTATAARALRTRAVTLIRAAHHQVGPLRGPPKPSITVLPAARLQLRLPGQHSPELTVGLTQLQLAKSSDVLTLSVDSVYALGARSGAVPAGAGGVLPSAEVAEAAEMTTPDALPMLQREMADRSATLYAGVTGVRLVQRVQADTETDPVIALRNDRLASPAAPQRRTSPSLYLPDGAVPTVPTEEPIRSRAATFAATAADAVLHRRIASGGVSPRMRLPPTPGAAASHRTRSLSLEPNAQPPSLEQLSLSSDSEQPSDVLTDSDNEPFSAAPPAPQIYPSPAFDAAAAAAAAAAGAAADVAFSDEPGESSDNDCLGVGIADRLLYAPGAGESIGRLDTERTFRVVVQAVTGYATPAVVVDLLVPIVSVAPLFRESAGALTLAGASAAADMAAIARRVAAVVWSHDCCGFVPHPAIKSRALLRVLATAHGLHDTFARLSAAIETSDGPDAMLSVLSELPGGRGTAVTAALGLTKARTTAILTAAQTDASRGSLRSGRLSLDSVDFAVVTCDHNTPISASTAAPSATALARRALHPVARFAMYHVDGRLMAAGDDANDAGRAVCRVGRVAGVVGTDLPRLVAAGAASVADVMAVWAVIRAAHCDAGAGQTATDSCSAEGSSNGADSSLICDLSIGRSSFAVPGDVAVARVEIGALRAVLHRAAACHAAGTVGKVSAAVTSPSARVWVSPLAAVPTATGMDGRSAMAARDRVVEQLAQIAATGPRPPRILRQRAARARAARRAARRGSFIPHSMPTPPVPSISITGPDGAALSLPTATRRTGLRGTTVEFSSDNYVSQGSESDLVSDSECSDIRSASELFTSTADADDAARSSVARAERLLNKMFTLDAAAAAEHPVSMLPSLRLHSLLVSTSAETTIHRVTPRTERASTFVSSKKLELSSTLSPLYAALLIRLVFDAGSAAQALKHAKEVIVPSQTCAAAEAAKPAATSDTDGCCDDELPKPGRKPAAHTVSLSLPSVVISGYHSACSVTATDLSARALLRTDDDGARVFTLTLPPGFIHCFGDGGRLIPGARLSTPAADVLMRPGHYFASVGQLSGRLPFELLSAGAEMAACMIAPAAISVYNGVLTLGRAIFWTGRRTVMSPKAAATEVTAAAEPAAAAAPETTSPAFASRIDRAFTLEVAFEGVNLGVQLASNELVLSSGQAHLLHTLRPSTPILVAAPPPSEAAAPAGAPPPATRAAAAALAGAAAAAGAECMVLLQPATHSMDLQIRGMHAAMLATTPPSLPRLTHGDQITAFHYGHRGVDTRPGFCLAVNVPVSKRTDPSSVAAAIGRLGEDATQPQAGTQSAEGTRSAFVVPDVTLFCNFSLAAKAHRRVLRPVRPPNGAAQVEAVERALNSAPNQAYAAFSLRDAHLTAHPEFLRTLVRPTTACRTLVERFTAACARTQELVGAQFAASIVSYPEPAAPAPAPEPAAPAPTATSSRAFGATTFMGCVSLERLRVTLMSTGVAAADMTYNLLSAAVSAAPPVEGGRVVSGRGISSGMCVAVAYQPFLPDLLPSERHLATYADANSDVPASVPGLTPSRTLLTLGEGTVAMGAALPTDGVGRVLSSVAADVSGPVLVVEPSSAVGLMDIASSWRNALAQWRTDLISMRARAPRAAQQPRQERLPGSIRNALRAQAAFSSATSTGGASSRRGFGSRLASFTRGGASTWGATSTASLSGVRTEQPVPTASALARAFACELSVALSPARLIGLLGPAAGPVVVAPQAAAAASPATAAAASSPVPGAELGLFPVSLQMRITAQADAPAKARGALELGAVSATISPLFWRVVRDLAAECRIRAESSTPTAEPALPERAHDPLDEAFEEQSPDQAAAPVPMPTRGSDLALAVAAGPYKFTVAAADFTAGRSGKGVFLRVAVPRLVAHISSKRAPFPSPDLDVPLAPRVGVFINIPSISTAISHPSYSADAVGLVLNTIQAAFATGGGAEARELLVRAVSVESRADLSVLHHLLFLVGSWRDALAPTATWTPAHPHASGLHRITSHSLDSDVEAFEYLESSYDFSDAPSGSDSVTTAQVAGRVSKRTGPPLHAMAVLGSFRSGVSFTQSVGQLRVGVNGPGSLAPGSVFTPILAHFIGLPDNDGWFASASLAPINVALSGRLTARAQTTKQQTMSAFVARGVGVQTAARAAPLQLQVGSAVSPLLQLGYDEIVLLAGVDSATSTGTSMAFTGSGVVAFASHGLSRDAAAWSHALVSALHAKVADFKRQRDTARARQRTAGPAAAAVAQAGSAAEAAHALVPPAIAAARATNALAVPPEIDHAAVAHVVNLFAVSTRAGEVRGRAASKAGRRTPSSGAGTASETGDGKCARAALERWSMPAPGTLTVSIERVAVHVVPSESQGMLRLSAGLFDVVLRTELEDVQEEDASAQQASRTARITVTDLAVTQLTPRTRVFTHNDSLASRAAACASADVFAIRGRSVLALLSYQAEGKPETRLHFVSRFETPISITSYIPRFTFVASTIRSFVSATAAAAQTIISQVDRTDATLSVAAVAPVASASFREICERAVAPAQTADAAAETAVEAEPEAEPGAQRAAGPAVQRVFDVVQNELAPRLSLAGEASPSVSTFLRWLSLDPDLIPQRLHAMHDVSEKLYAACAKLSQSLAQ